MSLTLAIPQTRERWTTRSRLLVFLTIEIDGTNIKWLQRDLWSSDSDRAYRDALNEHNPVENGADMILKELIKTRLMIYFSSPNGQLEAGGKPSTWFPPEGLFEPSWMLNKSVILVVLIGISSVCVEKYITRRVLMSSFRFWMNFVDLTSPHIEFLILLIVKYFWSKKSNIALCFSTLKSDSQSKRIAYSSPGHRKDSGKIFSSRIYVWISRNVWFTTSKLYLCLLLVRVPTSSSSIPYYSREHKALRVK